LTSFDGLCTINVSKKHAIIYLAAVFLSFSLAGEAIYAFGLPLPGRKTRGIS
jgi:hypothetical protein